MKDANLLVSELDSSLFLRYNTSLHIRIRFINNTYNYNIVNSVVCFTNSSYHMPIHQATVTGTISYLKAEFSCNSNIENFQKIGIKAIVSDESQSYYKNWLSFTIIRDTTPSKKGNDFIHLGFRDDSTIADLGDDFIEISNSHITAFGDAWPADINGGKDVFMVRSDEDIYLEGQVDSDQYFINIDSKFKEQQDEGRIVITELPSTTDKNKIHLCGFKFNNETSNTVTNLKKAGIDLLTSEDKNDLIVKLNYHNSNYYPTFVQLRDFCLYTDKDESVFDSLVDEDSKEISVNTILCSEI